MKIRRFIWDFKFTKICKNVEYEKRLLTACTLSCLHKEIRFQSEANYGLLENVIQRATHI